MLNNLNRSSFTCIPVILFNTSLERVHSSNSVDSTKQTLLGCGTEESISPLRNHSQGEAGETQESLSRTEEIMLRGSERGSM